MLDGVVELKIKIAIVYSGRYIGYKLYAWFQYLLKLAG